MIAPIVHFKNNRQPPLFGQILTDGVPVDLTGDTVTFYMRSVNDSTLKVSAGAVTIDTPTTGSVHYNWGASDLDTLGFYVGWWRVTLPSAQFEESPEFLIQVIDHDDLGQEYVSAEELKTTRAIRETFADADIRLAVLAASRAVDGICRRTFALGAAETRKFTAISPDFVNIDDAATITAVSVSAGTPLVLNTDYVLEAVAPYTQLRSFSGYVFPQYLTNAVSVTGTFGWPVIPPAVKAATTVIAGRLFQLMRSGSMISAGFDGTAIAIGLVDNNVRGLLAPYVRSSLEQ